MMVLMMHAPPSARARIASQMHAPRLVGWPMPDPCRVGEAATVRTHCTQPLWH